MGTNYYLQPKPPCDCCGREYERKHIGKSSCGWVFALRVYPDDGIHDLDDWLPLFTQPGARIKDEYGADVPPLDMVMAIISRSHRDGLQRSTVKGTVVKAGRGTWDCHTGDFS